MAKKGDRENTGVLDSGMLLERMPQRVRALVCDPIVGEDAAEGEGAGM